MTSRRPRAPHSLHQPGSPADVLYVSEMRFVTEMGTNVKANVTIIETDSEGPAGARA